MRTLTLLTDLLLTGCGLNLKPQTSVDTNQTLTEARNGFVTNVTKSGNHAGPADTPPAGSGFEQIRYQSPANEYGGDYIYCNLNEEEAIALRSPLFWMHGVKSPMYVFEGANQGNWDAVQMMADENKNSNIRFYKVPGHDHFSVIAPLTELLAQQIVAGQVNVTAEMVSGLR